LHGKEFTEIQRVFDPLLVGVLFWVVTSTNDTAVSGVLLHFTIFIIICLTLLFLDNSKVYEGYRQSRLWPLICRLSEGWIKVVTSLIIVAYLAKVSILFSRIDFITWAFLSWLALIIVHFGCQKILRLLRKHGSNSQFVVFLGSRQDAVKFHYQLNALPYLGLKLKAWFSLEPIVDSSSWPPLPQGMPMCSGEIDSLGDWLKLNRVDQIHFSYSDANCQLASMDELLCILGNTSLPTYYIPNWMRPGMSLNMEHLGDMCAMELWGHDDYRMQLRLKRLFDFSAALILILFALPLLLLLAISVRLSSPGPIIFCQDRYGLRGERFKIYKFRTMTVLENGDQCGLQQARRDDPRVTPVGSFMRRWSLDELPQLFNVLNGTMSLVGPRPHAVAHNEEYRALITGYMQRHQLRPGITGLAQVKGFRGETAKLSSMRNRIEADLQYLKEWSFLLDLQILVKTIFSLRSANAY
jgi:putative colanic acid biosynthesis UDP-glucose lipid carrier transferase